MCSCRCCGCLVLTWCWVGNGDEGGAPREAVWRRCLRRLRARRSYRFVMPILSLRHAHRVPHQLYRILRHISTALGVMKLLLLFVVYFYCMDFSVVVVRIWMFSPAGLCRCFVLVQGARWVALRAVHRPREGSSSSKRSLRETSPIRLMPARRMIWIK